MRHLFTTLLLILNGLAVFGQQIYNAQLIPGSLTAGATAVVRSKELRVEIKDHQNVTYYGKEAITILNARGDQHASIMLWYNRTRQIKDIKVVVFDALGFAISKFSERQFEDVSVANDFSLFEDSRVKKLHPTAPAYPYTIEYEYEIQSKQTLLIPQWIPKNSFDVAVEKSSFEVICPEGFNIRYKPVNFLATPEIVSGEKNTKLYRWNLNNISASKPEPFSPNPDELFPSVKIAANSFSYQGVKGEFTNWEEYGKWVYDVLLKDRSTLSDQTISYIRNLVKDIQEPKQKAKVIYEYMQKKTRYISVQIGIGGYQPALASEVDRLSYGDCKGLVNYMRALLDAVEIESYYTVVNSGSAKQDIDFDFASMNEGNHVILCLPFKNDTTWLECTNKDIPFGFLGNFTDDRLVVACTPAGGRIMRTPNYTYTHNLQDRKASFVIDQEGNASGIMTTAFKGAQYDTRQDLMQQKISDQVKSIKRLYSIENLEIGSLKLSQEKSSIPVTFESLKFTSNNYASKNQNRLYIPLNTVDKIDGVPANIKERVTPVYISRGYTDLDEIEFEVPENYLVEYQPKETAVNTDFASFKSSTQVNGSKILFKRTLQLKEGTYPIESYSLLIKFFEKVVEADNGKLVLIKRG